MGRGLRARAVALLLAALVPALAEGAVTRDDLTRLSIEELASVEVVTVSRQSESRLHAAGAVHVVTQEDIARSGATTLPDAMRLAPGLQASVIDADEWALGIRGFVSRLSRSVLVMIDGRSVWTPLFAGVFWNSQDAMLEDVDRIEVSRGPGGPLFGANALNGVIHVIGKRTRDTQGGLVHLGGGDNERLFGGIRWGDELTDELHYRVYAKYRDRDPTEPRTEAGYDDRWRMAQGGFRLDWERAGRKGLTLHGDVYDGESGARVNVTRFRAPFLQSVEGDVELRGGNLVALWRQTFAEAGDLSVRGYYDRTSRREPNYEEARDTFDLDVQHALAWGGRHQTLVGASYRASRGDFDGLFSSIQIVPSERTDDIAGFFAQDEMRLLGERLRLTLGSKFEWNDYSGWNVQPSARAAWRFGPRNTLWGAVTRSVRTASRLERDIVLYTALSPGQPAFVRLTGWPDFEPESVVMYELGFKARPLSRLYVDLAAFHGEYDDLATNEVGAPRVEVGRPPEPPRNVIPVRVGNGQEGSTSGVEASATASLTGAWRVQASYSFLRLNQRTKPGSTDFNEGFEGNSPRHQLWAASYLTLPGDVDVDLVFRRVGRIRTHRVPAFGELEARVAFRPWPDLELSVVGQNLLHSRHPEFGGGFDVERGVYARATLEW